MNMRKDMSPEALQMVAELFRVLSEAIRLRLLNLLRDGEMSVTELTQACRASQPNISKHLKILTEAGILRRDQRGNIVYYAIADKSIYQLCDRVCDSIGENLKAKVKLFATV
ncbi:metalloregulator ArsR/SmtB family transcription factor [soil metagenome]